MMDRETTPESDAGLVGAEGGSDLVSDAFVEPPAGRALTAGGATSA